MSERIAPRGRWENALRALEGGGGGGPGGRAGARDFRELTPLRWPIRFEEVSDRDFAGRLPVARCRVDRIFS